MSTTFVRRMMSAQSLLLARPPAPEPQPTPGQKITGRYCVDVSNYSGPLAQATLNVWKQDHDVGLVIVQAIEPPPTYPAGQTRQQILACANAGIVTDAYFYLWTGSNVEQDMRTKLALLNGIEDKVRRLWLDVEDTMPSSPAFRVTTIRQALAVLDGWSAAHHKPLPGIYTGRWWWTVYVNDTTEFMDRALWTSEYDGIPDPNRVTLYGGWRECRIKQHIGTSTLAGQGGIDQNVLSDAEMREG
jgi:hypothetical protein